MDSEELVARIAIGGMWRMITQCSASCMKDGTFRNKSSFCTAWQRRRGAGDTKCCSRTHRGALSPTVREQHLCGENGSAGERSLRVRGPTGGPDSCVSRRGACVSATTGALKFPAPTHSPADALLLGFVRFAAGRVQCRLRAPRSCPRGSDEPVSEMVSRGSRRAARRPGGRIRAFGGGGLARVQVP